MPRQRSRWLGDTRGQPPKPVPPKTPNKIEIYTVLWKDPGDKQKRKYLALPFQGADE
jgi:hypothetical protein